MIFPLIGALLVVYFVIRHYDHNPYLHPAGAPISTPSVAAGELRGAREACRAALAYLWGHLEVDSTSCSVLL